MSDTSSDPQPSQPFFGFEGEVLEIPPSTGFVVHELLSGGQGRGIVWAWCRVTDGVPGYSAVTFTGNDGVTARDPGEGFQLGPVLFKVFC